MEIRDYPSIVLSEEIKLEGPVVILAPMSGVTDLPSRKIVNEMGASLVVSEMIASRAMIVKSRGSLQRSGILPEDTKLSYVQIAGCDPKIVADAARMLEDMGAKIIDLNFGCPAKKIVGGFAGSALMKDEKLAEEIIKHTVNAVKVPVTLKMRMGWDSMNLNAPNIAKISEDNGIKMLTVHGRTRCQFYSGTANWKFINQVKKAVKIPVIANGDIRCPHSAKQALEDSGADGIMVGRATYGKPWLISIIREYLETGVIKEEPSNIERKNIITKHYNDILNFYGEEHGVKIARKHMAWYSNNMKNSAQFRATINRLNDPLEVKKLVDDFFTL